MRIEWTADAAADVDRMLEFIAGQSPAAATIVTERLLEAEKTLLTFPHAGRYDQDTDTYDRFIPRTHIVLTYAIRDDVIWIVTAWHTSRDPVTKPRRRSPNG